MWACFRVQTPPALSVPAALICWAFKSLPTPGACGFRKAVPQAPEPGGAWPEGGQLNSGEKELKSLPPPPTASGLHNAPGSKQEELVSICPRKIQGFPLPLVWSAPAGPFEPQKVRARNRPWGGQGAPQAAPSHVPSHLSPSEPATGLGSLRVRHLAEALSDLFTEAYCAQVWLCSQEFTTHTLDTNTSRACVTAPRRSGKAPCHLSDLKSWGGASCQRQQVVQRSWGRRVFGTSKKQKERN